MLFLAFQLIIMVSNKERWGIMETTGERILRLREEKEMKQKELADLVGITEASLSRYENNKRVPSGEIISKIASALKVSTDYLLGLTDNTTNIDPELLIPKEYSDKYKVTSRDKKQHKERLKKINEAFFMNDNYDETDKKELLDSINELFWDAKVQNKRKT